MASILFLIETIWRDQFRDGIISKTKNFFPIFFFMYFWGYRLEKTLLDLFLEGLASDYP